MSKHHQRNVIFSIKGNNDFFYLNDDCDYVMRYK